MHHAGQDPDPAHTERVARMRACPVCFGAWVALDTTPRPAGAATKCRECDPTRPDPTKRHKAQLAYAGDCARCTGERYAQRSRREAEPAVLTASWESGMITDDPGLI